MLRCDPILPGEIRDLIVVPSCFGKETGGGSPVFDAELRINVFKMFAYGCGRNSEDYTDLGVGFSSGEPAEDLALPRSQ